MDRDQVGPFRKGQIYRSAADRAEAMGFQGAAVAGNPPFLRSSLRLHVGALAEGQIGRMPGSAAPTAIGALAMVLENRRCHRPVAQSAAGAAELLPHPWTDFRLN